MKPKVDDEGTKSESKPKPVFKPKVKAKKSDDGNDLAVSKEPEASSEKPKATSKKPVFRPKIKTKTTEPKEEEQSPNPKESEAGGEKPKAAGKKPVFRPKIKPKKKD